MASLVQTSHHGPEPSTTATLVAAPNDSDNPLEIFVVIAATIRALADGKRHRIVSVIPLDPSPDWAREGRRDIFSSHRFR